MTYNNLLINFNQHQYSEVLTQLLYAHFFVDYDRTSKVRKNDESSNKCCGKTMSIYI
jgi:hypothetical protein